MQAFVDMCRQPVLEYLNRFNFASPLLKSMYAVTDGFSGLTGSWQTPGTGLNFLMHNMVRFQEQHTTKRTELAFGVLQQEAVECFGTVFVCKS